MPVFCLLLSYNDYLPNALYPNQPESSDGGGNIVSSMLLIKLLPLKFTFLKLHMIQYWCNWNKARLQVIVRLKLKNILTLEMFPNPENLSNHVSDFVLKFWADATFFSASNACFDTMFFCK